MPKPERCSICGRDGEMQSSGPGPHKFHGECINGAYNFMALIKEIGGDYEAKRMAYWPSATKAGITHPFPPFRKQ